MAEIMVIEDDSILADLIQLSLEQRDHQVTCYVKKTAAIAALAKTKPDLVILDLFLLKTDTLALIRQLREPLHGNIPPVVIVISAFGYSEVVEGALEAGAAGYLLKPLDPDMLLERVQTVLAQREMLWKKYGKMISKPQFRRLH